MVMVMVKATAIRRGFELYENLLVVDVVMKILNLDNACAFSSLTFSC